MGIKNLALMCLAFVSCNNNNYNADLVEELHAVFVQSIVLNKEYNQYLSDKILPYNTARNDTLISITLNLNKITSRVYKELNNGNLSKIQAQDSINIAMQPLRELVRHYFDRTPHLYDIIDTQLLFSEFKIGKNPHKDMLELKIKMLDIYQQLSLVYQYSIIQPCIGERPFIFTDRNIHNQNDPVYLNVAMADFKMYEPLEVYLVYDNDTTMHMAPDGLLRVKFEPWKSGDNVLRGFIKKKHTYGVDEHPFEYTVRVCE